MCMRVHVHVCIRTCIYVCIGLCVCIYICVLCACVCICMCDAYMYVCVCVYDRHLTTLATATQTRDQWWLRTLGFEPLLALSLDCTPPSSLCSAWFGVQGGEAPGYGWM